MSAYALSFPTHCFAYGQTSLLCPESVICSSNDAKSCHILNNPFNLWDQPILSIAKKPLQGTHYLTSVSANSKDNDSKNILKQVACGYGVSDEKYTWQTNIFFSVYLKNPQNIYFKKLTKIDSLWHDDGYCFNEHQGNIKTAITPSYCPMVQAAGVSILENTSITFFYPNPRSYFEQNYISGKWLTYAQLHQQCGATSNCIIDIGVCDRENETCESYGSIDIDISNKDIVKINQVNNAQNSPYVFKQKETFNIIQVS